MKSTGMITLMSKALSAEDMRTRRLEQRFPARLVGTLSSALDRSLPVPLGLQLRGLIEYGIACGELVPVRSFHPSGSWPRPAGSRR